MIAIISVVWKSVFVLVKLQHGSVISNYQLHLSTPPKSLLSESNCDCAGGQGQPPWWVILPWIGGHVNVTYSWECRLRFHIRYSYGPHLMATVTRAIAFCCVRLYALFLAIVPLWFCLLGLPGQWGTWKDRGVWSFIDFGIILRGHPLFTDCMNFYAYKSVSSQTLTR